LPKQTAPGNWLDNKIEGAEKKKDGTSTSISPLVNPIDSQIAVAFPSGKPFEDTPEIVQCKHCKKPVLKLAATAHVKDCLKKKQEKAQKKREAKEAKDAALRKERNGGVSPDPSVDEEAGKRGTVSARKTALDGDGGGKKVPGKKRKADDDDDVKGPSAKKKKKEEVKPKGGKPKGPVDVEKQCGVVLANGQQCARSLTCKSHSMGAKRAVPGRSLPYDVLLNQYQKKNQAKLQRKSFNILLAKARELTMSKARRLMQMHHLRTILKLQGM
jgi:SAGA-associated factor 73